MGIFYETNDRQILNRFYDFKRQWEKNLFLTRRRSLLIGR
jgi:hypothetical protein